jgi:DNA-binding CsgD family transcriptional regulator
MDIRPLRKAAPRHDPFRNDAAILIDSMGTRDFETNLLRLTWEALRCEHLSAFALSETNQPRLLLGMNSGAPNLAHHVGTLYAQRYWHMDPVNQVALPSGALSEGIVVRLTEEDLSRSPYRRDLYGARDWAASGAKLVERLSMVKRQDNEIVRINFYRHCDVGPFESDDLDRLAASADLLFALVTKHAALRVVLQTAGDCQTYEKLLRLAAPSLSPRELEVCAGIAVGMTSEAIASKLGIRLNTVLTYRKRAYARLNISSQLELLRLVFSALTNSKLQAEAGLTRQ